MCTSIHLYAQAFCSTPTENSVFLSRLTNYRSSTYNDSTFCLRVYFHVIRKTNGSGASIIQNNISEAYNLLNEDFNPHGIFLFGTDMSILLTIPIITIILVLIYTM